MTNDNVTVIIRSIGERTEALCKKLILEQDVPGENVVIVKEAPFSKALTKSLQIGIEKKLPWTLCVDADVLLRQDVIKFLINEAYGLNKNAFKIQGYILDKFFGGPRAAGHYLYRTEHLGKMLKLIPEEGVDIRPESYALLKMKELGFTLHNAPLLVGLHDFEQYFRDIFRKCFVYAHKHIGYRELFISYWMEHAKINLDYRVALAGLGAGIQYFDEIYIDINHSIYSDLFNRINIKEKPKFGEKGISFYDIELIINNWQEPRAYNKLFPSIIEFKNGYMKKNYITYSKIKLLGNRFQETGLIRFIPYIIGSVLKKVGIKFINLSK